MPVITHVKAQGSTILRIPLCQPRSLHWYGWNRGPVQLTIDGREVPHERVVEEMSGS